MHADNLAILSCPVCGPPSAVRAGVILSETDGEWTDAILLCSECGRWFRIEEGIADLVRDGLRDHESDRRFLEHHAARLPKEILEDGKPYGLRGEIAEPGEEDRRIIEEGIHWGRFMRRFWDAGDRSIFDIRVKGTHPPLYIAGVLEPDDRDLYRRWGNFPNATGDLLFTGLKLLAGKRGIDAGCGGGQFGLEAARQGVHMIGFDPSFEEVSLARQQARENGVQNIDYLRAEPAHPPFQRGTFDLFMAKDALHHVPNLPAAFDNMMSTLTPEAVAVIHEHICKAPLKDRLLRAIGERAVPKIRRRYANHPIPEELLRDSANEDVSGADIEPLLHRNFVRVNTTEDLFFANDLEMYVYFAYGKRRWLSRIAFAAGVVIEDILKFTGQRQHLSFVGRRRAS